MNACIAFLPINTSKTMTSQDELRILQRIAQAIERLAPQPEPLAEVKSADCFSWSRQEKQLLPLLDTRPMPLAQLQGIDEARDVLLANTRQFARGFRANHALITGPAGSGKSALVQAVWAEVNRGVTDPLKRVALVEIKRQDLASLPQLVHALQGWVIRRFIIVCEDARFEQADAAQQALLGTLEGGLAPLPDHLVIYATAPTPASPAELALHERFGLQLGLPAFDLESYVALVTYLALQHKLPISPEELQREASSWVEKRGAHHGRVAWHFIVDLAGRLGKKLA
jgi:predicted AAA+ superfamily ATPase